MYPSNFSHSSKARVTPGIILVAAMLVVAVLIYIYWGFAHRKPGPTLEETKAYLLSGSRITLPSTSPLRIVPQSEVPQGLRWFLLGGAEGLLVKRGTQQNGGEVYKITFVHAGPFATVYDTLWRAARTAPGWTVLRVARANLFAVIEARSDAYEVRANLTPKNGLTDVSVETVAQ